MRLIDADALMNEANSDGAYGYVDAKQISEAPTVDAVPVVRCRECKHRGTDDCIFHIKGEPADEELLLKLDNDFCSYGERKEVLTDGLLQSFMPIQSKRNQQCKSL